MELKGRQSDEDLSSSKRRRLSERTLKLLEEKASFPNVSKCRRKRNKLVFSCFGDTHELPDSLALNKEYNIGSYFDTECTVYSESFRYVPNVEVGKQLDVLELLGDNLFSFSTSSHNVPSILPTGFTSYVGSCDPNKGTDKGSRNPQRIQPPILRRCVNVDEGVLASTSSTTTGKENVNVESTLNLKGKYVMICCAYVPSIWCSTDGPMVYHTALASHELARRDDFVLVVVPMMREGFTHSRSAYLHFLSGFSCHAVPFNDSRRREYICSALRFDGKLKVVILDPSQKILYHGPPDMFFEFGGAEHDCFPFTPERMENCLYRDSILKDLSLNEILGLSDTDVLWNVLKDGCLTISELKQKFVGLYVCSEGTSLRSLHEVHDECRRQKYELEIVVVCCPCHRQVPPKLHEELIIEALASLKLLGWWFFPFENTVCRRLGRMCKGERYEEGLFIVDPIEKHVDPYGLPIILDFGVEDYPFTRRKLIEKELQRKMGLRLNSLLLPWGTVTASLDSHDVFRFPTGMLQNKIVVLYLYIEPWKLLADKLAAWHKKNIKRKHSNVVEVVAVSIDGSGASEKHLMDKGWFVCRADPSKSCKLCDEYFHPLCGVHETLVAFGEDGRIQSMDPNHILESQFPPFHGNLREEIAREFEDAGFHYMQGTLMTD
ncbi:unnamed protein product [Cuscuta campestris]|uniref:Uncharacterized protein n=1 Tax=Cuscuta campestris TaxID=132261 RepID=A0A484LAU6_9ASTE|nr:unnamed protein product [Cuscuta campestris]